jgi:hypothetical protein
MKTQIKKHCVIYYTISIFAVLALFLSSCSTARLTSSWSLPGASTHKYEKVLVIGMTGDKDRDIRESIENAIVKKLNEYNINAQSASSKYGPRTFQDMSDEEVTKQVKDDGFDAVMILALLDKDKEKYYTPGDIIHTPYAIIGNHWRNHYRVLYARVYTPDYYTTSINYELEANFYDATQDELQYSSLVKSVYPGSSGFQAGDFSKLVITDMIKKGIITK